MNQPKSQKIYYKETFRTSRAKTRKGYLKDVIKAFDYVMGKGWGEEELSVIHEHWDKRTVRKRLLAGETVSYHTEEFGYDLDPIGKNIYVYCGHRNITVDDK